MKRIRRSTLNSHLALLMGALVLTGASGCTTGPVDSSDALIALSNCRDRLAIHEQQQAALAADLTHTIADVAVERLRLALLLDLDDLSAPGGEVDPATIRRMLQDGSENAIINEVRLGRLSIEQATQLVRDATAVRHLSPEVRVVAEEQLVERFLSWQRLVATRKTLLERLNEQHAAAVRLLDEIAHLTDAIRSASSMRQEKSIRAGALARRATNLIEDPELRDSTRSLIDLLLEPAGATANSSARNQD